VPGHKGIDGNETTGQLSKAPHIHLQGLSLPSAHMRRFPGSEQGLDKQIT